MPKRKARDIGDIKPPKGEVKFALRYTPRNDGQRELRRVWGASKLVVCSGPAGTGKTTAAFAEALAEIRSGAKQRVWLCRPLIPADEEVGHLPGALDEKLSPWLRAFRDILSEVGGAKWTELSKVVEGIPLAMARSLTITDGTLIVDESQNCTWRQLVLLGSRVGRNARVVFCGDTAQSDRFDNPADVPLTQLIRRVSGLAGASAVDFSRSENVREEFVTRFLAAVA